MDFKKSDHLKSEHISSEGLWDYSGGKIFTEDNAKRNADVTRDFKVTST